MYIVQLYRTFKNKVLNIYVCMRVCVCIMSVLKFDSLSLSIKLLLEKESQRLVTLRKENAQFDSVWFPVEVGSEA